MVAALPLILDVQFMLSGLNFDIAVESRRVIRPVMRERCNRPV